MTRPPGEAEAGPPLPAQRGELRVKAPGKVNLYLHVVGRRPDGYHFLDSLVAFVEAGDEIAVGAAEALSLVVEGPYAGALEADDDNLVFRAARLLGAEFEVSQGAAITLTKNLPVAAGLGGGSSDAAATLGALASLWGIDADEAVIMRLAAELGADVPVCRLGATAHMSGIGEVLAPAPALPPCGVVLVNPGKPLSTPTVFRGRHGPFSATEPVTGKMKSVEELVRELQRRRNDLTASACDQLPEIRNVLKALEDDPACLLARLSGSGPTCFGIYADVAPSRQAANRIARAHASWWVQPTWFIESCR